MILIFCRDGHLRLKQDFGLEDNGTIPLLNLETFGALTETNALRFWKNYWFHPIAFEEGLTFRNFFCNLEPWIDFFQDIIPQPVDLRAFLAEIKKPSLSAKASKPNAEPLCDFLSINQVSNISPCMFKKDRSKNHYLPITETNGKWRSQYQIQLTGCYRDLREITFNIENTPLNLLANKPIFLNRNHYIIVDRYLDSVAKKNNIHNSIFRHDDDAYGAFELNEMQDLLISERQINLFELLQNIFNFFYMSPDERDVTMDNIDKFLNNISFDEAKTIFSMPDEDIEEKLIEENVTEDDSNTLSDIMSLVETIQKFNASGSIPQFSANIPLQKNAFTHLDYKIHLIKTPKDSKILKTKEHDDKIV